MSIAPNYQDSPVNPLQPRASTETKRWPKTREFFVDNSISGIVSFEVMTQPSIDMSERPVDTMAGRSARGTASVSLDEGKLGTRGFLKVNVYPDRFCHGSREGEYSFDAENAELSDIPLIIATLQGIYDAARRDGVLPRPSVTELKADDKKSKGEFVELGLETDQNYPNRVELVVDGSALDIHSSTLTGGVVIGIDIPALIALRDGLTHLIAADGGIEGGISEDRSCRIAV